MPLVIRKCSTNSVCVCIVRHHCSYGYEHTLAPKSGVGNDDTALYASTDPNAAREAPSGLFAPRHRELRVPAFFHSGPYQPFKRGPVLQMAVENSPKFASRHQDAGG